MLDTGQILFNAAVTGSLYLLAGTGLTLTYGLSRFPNFAYAEFITFGGYIGHLFLQQADGSLPLALITAFFASGILSVLSYRFCFHPLIDRKASLIPLMIASIALGYVIRYAIGEVWSWSALSYQPVWSAFELGGIRVTALWLYLVGAALLTGTSLHFLLTYTKTGKAIRAIASNPELALVSGVNSDRVVLFTWFTGAALAGVAGVFRAADTQLFPMLGWDILLIVFAAVILGGIGSFYGLIAAAYILGLVENFGVVLLQAVGLSTEYRMAIAFLVLILVLIVRPKGLAR
jgi:branched-subunit amino acid ABC-type transport system permease component